MPGDWFDWNVFWTVFLIGLPFVAFVVTRRFLRFKDRLLHPWKYE